MTNKERIKRNLNTFFPLQNTDSYIVDELENQICINDFCFLPIRVPAYFDNFSDIIIKDNNSVNLGKIRFFKSESSVELRALPFESFCCFLIENPTEVIQDTHYKFIYDYLIVRKNELSDYLALYKKTSPVWGGFFHIDNLPNNAFLKKKTYSEILAIKSIKVDKNFYWDALELVLVEPNPFNRFLKLYHLLEMQFDMHTAEKINSLFLAGNSEKEISRTLRDYNREDIERLKSLFSLKLDNNSFISLLDNIISYKLIADSLFYEYGKESNPIKSKKDFDSITTLGSFNQTNINRVFGNDRFNDLVPKIIAYWIYRVRSSIAHNKLGEYLMSVNDEEFIMEFAEPLIRQVIIQCYKS